MENKLVAGIVAAAIAVIVLAGVLMPALDNATETQKTLVNEGYARFSNTGEETVITWTPSVDKSIITVNGTDISLANFPTQIGGNNASYSIAFSDDFVLRVGMDPSGVNSIQFWQNGYKAGMNKTVSYTGTYTINDSSISFNSGAPDAVTSSFTHSGEYKVINPAGDMIMKTNNTASYVYPETSVVYAGGLSDMNENTRAGIYFEGTVGNYDFNPMLSGVTVDNVETNYTVSSDYRGVLLLQNITFDTTYNSDVVHQTYSYFLVPYEITAEKVQHLSDAQIVILDVIPMLVIVAVLLGVVAIFIIRRE